jgi:nucleotidyltransferase substrate binding protein (TIGR01987 family)
MNTDADLKKKSLDIEPLKNAVKALEKNISVYDANISGGDADLKEALRSSVIHNFEVAYELCWKYMKKWLEINVEPNIIIGSTRKEFYRIARENGLISDVKKWWEFHDARNRTSHTYNELTAESVFNAAVEFVPIAKKYVVDLDARL